MSDAIACALITGGLSLLGVIISNISTRNKIQQDIKIHQAVTDTKIEELTREVREHNNFAKRVPLAERDIEHIFDEIKELKDYHK